MRNGQCIWLAQGDVDGSTGPELVASSDLYTWQTGLIPSALLNIMVRETAVHWKSTGWNVPKEGIYVDAGI